MYIGTKFVELLTFLFRKNMVRVQVGLYFGLHTCGSPCPIHVEASTGSSLGWSDINNSVQRPNSKICVAYTCLRWLTRGSRSLIQDNLVIVLYIVIRFKNPVNNRNKYDNTFSLFLFPQFKSQQFSVKTFYSSTSNKFFQDNCVPYGESRLREVGINSQIK